MNKLNSIQFYLNERPDFAGRYFRQYKRLSPREMEQSHDWIQFAFPNPVPSRFCVNAPLLTPLLKNVINHPQIVDEHRQILDRYDFAYKVDDLSTWLTPYNHNTLRISRILTFLKETGLESPFVDKIVNQIPDLLKQHKISVLTAQIWDNLVVDILHKGVSNV